MSFHHPFVDAPSDSSSPKQCVRPLPSPPPPHTHTHSATAHSTHLQYRNLHNTLRWVIHGFYLPFYCHCSVKWEFFPCVDSIGCNSSNLYVRRDESNPHQKRKGQQHECLKRCLKWFTFLVYTLTAFGSQTKGKITAVLTDSHAPGVNIMWFAMVLVCIRWLCTKGRHSSWVVYITYSNAPPNI